MEWACQEPDFDTRRSMVKGLIDGPSIVRLDAGMISLEHHEFFNPPIVMEQLMTIDRRLLLKRAAVASGSLSVGAIFLGCKTVGRGNAVSDSQLNAVPVDLNIPKRVSWNSLSPDDKVKFIDAVKKLKITMVDVPETFGTLGKRRGDRWALQAETHRWYCDHSNWRFLPWHRAYLYQFELYLRKEIRDSFRLPYWPWEVEKDVPAELRDAELLKALGTTRQGSTVVTGEAPADFMSLEWWQKVVADLLVAPDFDTIGGDVSSSGMLESPAHNMVHVALGGDMGIVARAGNDPAFWLHHCNIDRMWSQWMDKRIAAGDLRSMFPSQNVSQWLNESFPNHFWNADDKIVSSNVRSSLFTQDMGYNYDGMSQTWEIGDIPKDQEVVEQDVAIKEADSISTSSLRLANQPGGVLHLGFDLPAKIADRLQALSSLRLKCYGIPVPTVADVGYQVELILDGKTYNLPEMAFFKGEHTAHKDRAYGLSLTRFAKQIQAASGRAIEGQLVFKATTKKGEVIAFKDAVSGFSPVASNYQLKFKTVYR